MRKIKFRAWDKVNNKFVYLTLGRVAWMRHVHNSLALDELDYQQFTELLDKNGKEIYEGDIIKGCGKFRDVVTFENGYFKWDGSPITIDFDEPDAIYDTEKWAEVIGNIHENPELIKTP